MNFLSHYYFEQEYNAYRILGQALPDLVKNHDKSWSLHPDKYPEKFNSTDLYDIYQGWQRHLLVDKVFHQSDFFIEKTHEIKTAIGNLFDNSPVRAYFLAHIALELLLDHLLIIKKNIDPKKYYTRLESCDESLLLKFLEMNGVKNPQSFLIFYHRFCEQQYLFSYEHIDNIAYALNRICFRVWRSNFTETQSVNLNLILSAYNQKLSTDFIRIFDHVSQQMN